ncbi:MAG: Hsp20/alpha crystallin family protein [Bacteroidetes bacterium]|nr:Hsp20/alpha crystallin family protein [Bacteroidota bacterium]
METKAVSKSKYGWPSIVDNGGWLDKFFKSPLDEYFNFGRVLNVPAVNVSEADHQYSLSIAAPGLEKKDFNLQVEGGVMRISAEKEERSEKNGDYNRREYNFSSWSRSFTLPEDADEGKIKAEYKNGELKIEIPRTESKPKSKAKSITIG